MKNTFTTTKLSLSLVFLIAGLLTVKMLGLRDAQAHCQIPCGIYGDKTRFTIMEEHIATIEKAMKQITELSAEAAANQNQIVRWTVNKESHAQEIQDIVAEYFLAQRIKTPKDASGEMAYVAHLKLLHAVTVHSMKCKQTTDLANVANLKKSLGSFKDSYLKK